MRGAPSTEDTSHVVVYTHASHTCIRKQSISKYAERKPHRLATHSSGTQTTPIRETQQRNANQPNSRDADVEREPPQLAERLGKSGSAARHVTHIVGALNGSAARP